MTKPKTDLYIEVDGKVSIVEKTRRGKVISSAVINNMDVAAIMNLFLEKILSEEFLDKYIESKKDK